MFLLISCAVHLLVAVVLIQWFKSEDAVVPAVDRVSFELVAKAPPVSEPSHDEKAEVENEVIEKPSTREATQEKTTTKDELVSSGAETETEVTTEPVVEPDLESVPEPNQKPVTQTVEEFEQTPETETLAEPETLPEPESDLEAAPLAESLATETHPEVISETVPNETLTSETLPSKTLSSENLASESEPTASASIESQKLEQQDESASLPLPPTETEASPPVQFVAVEFEGVAPTIEKPAQAVRKRLSGLVVLRGFVDEAGAIESLTVFQSSTHKELDEAALNQAKTWKFKPAFIDGRATGQWVEIPVQFR